jgi:hypothetical protein
MTETGWAWFEPGDWELPAGADGELLTIAGRWLSGPDADRMLAHLRAITLERTLGPAAPARALAPPGRTARHCRLSGGAARPREGTLIF